jgi:hypothetical protein
MYFMLPGPYEWEPGSREQARAAVILPPIAVAGFALATGRLAPLIGHSLNATLIGSGVLLLLALPALRALPRVAIAAAPSALLLTGQADAQLREAHLPLWLAWLVLSCVSLIVSARLYVFAVLPTLAACWFVTRLG